MSLKKRIDDIRVFPPEHGTGRIDQNPAVPDRFRRMIENLFLSRRQFLQPLRLCNPARIGIPSPASGGTARGIDQNSVIKITLAPIRFFSVPFRGTDVRKGGAGGALGGQALAGRIALGEVVGAALTAGRRPGGGGGG